VLKENGLASAPPALTAGAFILRTSPWQPRFSLSFLQRLVGWFRQTRPRPACRLKSRLVFYSCEPFYISPRMHFCFCFVCSHPDLAWAPSNRRILCCCLLRSSRAKRLCDPVRIASAVEGSLFVSRHKLRFALTTAFAFRFLGGRSFSADKNGCRGAAASRGVFPASTQTSRVSSHSVAPHCQCPWLA
jgi:hypothetical protein